MGGSHSRTSVPSGMGKIPGLLSNRRAPQAVADCIPCSLLALIPASPDQWIYREIVEMAEGPWSKMIQLHIYDLTRGLIAELSPSLLGKAL